MTKKRFLKSIHVFITAFFIISSTNHLAYSKDMAAKQNLSPKALRAMARIYIAAENYEKAEPLLEQALSMAKISGEKEELCTGLLDAAWLLHKQNRLEKAEKFCELGLKLQKSRKSSLYSLLHAES